VYEDHGNGYAASKYFKFTTPTTDPTDGASVLGDDASVQGQVDAAAAAQADAEAQQLECHLFRIGADGEHNEGNLWEAMMFAGKNRLSNLTGIIDRNNIQIDGMTEDIMPLEPFADKYRAFGWHVLEVDGHNIPQFIAACHEAQAIFEKPTVIIAHTIPGKGVKEIEGDYRWHGKPPSKDEAARFLQELRTFGGQMAGEHQ
jgi:transketolase